MHKSTHMIPYLRRQLSIVGQRGVRNMTMIPELEAQYIKAILSFYLRAALITTALALCLLAGCNREAWAEVYAAGEITEVRQ